jgi:hypothetical protein
MRFDAREAVEKELTAKVSTSLCLSFPACFNLYHSFVVPIRLCVCRDFII